MSQFFLAHPTATLSLKHRMSRVPNVPVSQNHPIAQLALMMYDSRVKTTHAQSSICVNRINVIEVQ